MHAETPARSPGRGWFSLPLFLRIAIGLVFGAILGGALRPMWHGSDTKPWLVHVQAFCDGLSTMVVMRLLVAVAYPLICMAVVRSLVATEIRGKAAGKLLYLLCLNTVVAILIGLLVANVLKPGTHAPPEHLGQREVADPAHDLLAKVPTTVLGPLVDNNAIGIVIVALTFGIAARQLQPASRAAVLRAVTVGFEWIEIVLHWVLELVPLAVAGKVAGLLIHDGVEPFKALAWFVVAVLFALLLQGGYYLLRVAWRSWVTPRQLVRGTGDALVMALSTGSSVASAPLAYECLTKRVGVKPHSASLGVLVGGVFNHDGTALYEAMSALFVSQAIGVHLTLGHQVLVVLTSMVAAFGAAGIPEAGLVTMTLVFSAVNLPVSLVGMLLPVDWFLDRCRTAINVMGDTSVACLLDGLQRRAAEPVAEAVS